MRAEKGSEEFTAMSLDLDHGKANFILDEASICKEEAKMNPPWKNSVQNISEGRPQLNLAGDDGSESQDKLGKTLSQVREEDIREAFVLPTVHEGQMSKKLTRPFSTIRSKSLMTFSESSIEQSYQILARPASPHPLSPRNVRRSRNLSMPGGNFSPLQQRATENQAQQNIYRKISNQGSLNGSLNNDCQRPRLLRRSCSANALVLQKVDALAKADMLPMKLRSFSDSHDEREEASFSRRTPYMGNSNSYSNENIQVTSSITALRAPTGNNTPLGTHDACLLQTSSNDDKLQGLQVQRTPTPVVSRALPSRPASSIIDIPRRLRPLSPIKMPLESAGELFTVSPITTANEVDALEPEILSKNHLAQEKIAIFFKKMIIAENSKDDEIEL